MHPQNDPPPLFIKPTFSPQISATPLSSGTEWMFLSFLNLMSVLLTPPTRILIKIWSSCFDYSSQNIFHHNLKSSKILISEDEIFVICDLESKQMTQENYSAKTKDFDVYSFDIIVCFIISGGFCQSLFIELTYHMVKKIFHITFQLLGKLYLKI
ncbi:hypothetical protein M9Y10_043319 [Tritrichomonas musculus]|uniref:Protein kinase domain-containing protein n=1 Tax=Tritrichomonas musculus TaxID=1915356 RepID=A0ABR2JZE9_9EUKA